MRNKMITLCPTTYELAQKMPNFSSWVRMRLLETQFKEGDARKEAFKPKPPANYLCRHCKLSGHWSDECPMIEVIE